MERCLIRNGAARMIGLRTTCLIVAVLGSLLLCGCGHMPSRYSFGVRPDVTPSEPPPDTVVEKCLRRHPTSAGAGVIAKTATTPDQIACVEFEGVQQWSADMEESYLARSTQNRWWIYVAGALGLATVAASGGLAAAGAVGLGTIALLNVSGGFATGFFAVLNNSDLATIYTLAAADI